MGVNPLTRATKTERSLVASSFINSFGLHAAYFVGILGYAAYGFNAGPALIATIMFFVNFCSMLGSAAGGIIVDKIGPRRSTITFSLIMAVLCIAGQWTGSNIVLYIIFVSALDFCVSVTNTSYASFAPYLERDRTGLKRVNSLVMIGSYSAAIIGPAVGGVITEFFPILRVFIFAAVGLLVALVIVLPVRERYQPERKPKADRHPLKDATEGVRLIFSMRSLRFYLTMGIFMWFAFGAFDALESLYYKDVLAVGPEWMGWINAVTGIGLVIGVGILSKLKGRYINAKLLAAMLCVEGLGTLLYIGTHSVWWSMTGALILGVAFGINEPLMRTLIQADSPLESSGRVLGTIGIFRVGMTLIPLVIAPTLSKWLGVQGVLIAASILTTLSAFALIPQSLNIDRETAASRKISSVDPFADADESNPHDRTLYNTEDANLIYEE
jgi:MFS family permease